MERTYIKDLKERVGEEIKISGFAQTIRIQSKIIFLLVRDITGITQTVVMKENPSFKEIRELSLESVVEVFGKVKEEKQAPGGFEIEISSVNILSRAEPELPIPVVFQKGGEETEAPRRFDNRWIDLRKEEHSKIFKVWTELEKGFRNFWNKENYIQIYTPSFMPTPSESGADVFEVGYFERKAYLAQSPQFYKQMAMASGFEKVFIVGPVFRAEESFTTRHMTEFTGWDFEISYIKDHQDLMDEEEKMIVAGFKQVKETFPEIEIEVPQTPFPRITMLEAKKILKERGIESLEKHDLSPEEEREICKYVKEEMDHDFVFITEYHKEKSPFYHMKLEEESERFRRADLLYRGIEVTTLAQREHRPEVLEKQAQDGGFKTGIMDLESLADYINFFRYGCPPHGGGGIGPGRLIMKMLDLPNVREATFLPRDVRRINP